MAPVVNFLNVKCYGCKSCGGVTPIQLAVDVRTIYNPAPISPLEFYRGDRARVALFVGDICENPKLAWDHDQGQKPPVLEGFGSPLFSPIVSVQSVSLHPLLGREPTTKRVQNNKYRA